MRPPVTKKRVELLMMALGASVRGEGRIYFTGGVTALLYGWRTSTIDIDLKAIPEPVGLYEAIAAVKERENMNIELASPDDFIPQLPGWQERSLFIARQGKLDFYHYDPYAQALSKIERGHPRDKGDVAAMLAAGLVQPERLLDLFHAIEPALIRYPAVSALGFRTEVEALCAK